MRITEKFRDLFFNEIKKSLELGLVDQELQDGLTTESLIKAVYNDLIEFLENFDFRSPNVPASEPGFGEEGLLEIEDNGEFEEGD